MQITNGEVAEQGRNLLLQGEPILRVAVGHHPQLLLGPLPSASYQDRAYQIQLCCWSVSAESSSGCRWLN